MKKQLVLVTGGAGHVGSHVIEQLLLSGCYDVVSLDNYSNGTINNHIDGARYVFAETKDINSLNEDTPDLVFHLGEYARIAPSLNEPKKVFEYNAVGTFAVVEFCRNRGVKKLIYAASSTKFATQGEERHRNPYSFTKANNVDLINNYGKWYDLPYAICYFYNAYGPRENGCGKYATLIAKFEQAYLNGEPLTVVRPGTQKRNFTHVSDLAKGMIAVAENGCGDGYALNSVESYSVTEIAEAFGGKIKYIDGTPGRMDSGESPVRARQELGWETTINVIDYIEDFKKRNPR